CGLAGGDYPFVSAEGSLAVATVGADGFSVSGVQTIVPQGSAPGRPAYPSFSPDSEWIAFGRPEGIGSYSYGTGHLWIVHRDGSDPKILATAGQGGEESYNPVFAPRKAGGYSWLVF